MSISEKRKIGNIGEDLACKFLKKEGFKIIETNDWKKWGEIDVVVKNRKTKKLYFIEVKTVSCDGLKEGIPDKMS
ncbi:MAG: YraN family protein, partial [Patescibacteria group bacterium]|nr:YraN family protein [Patescibacteria group bacterium]